MNLREALIQQAPSLALQRAAADEIAKLDAEVRSLSNIVQAAWEVIAKADPVGAAKLMEAAGVANA
jgi:hypothetical protein